MLYRGRVILGGVFMRHYDILFDREAEKIHFTRSNCSDEYKGPYFTDDIGLFKPENKTQSKITKKKLKYF